MLNNLGAYILLIRPGALPYLLLCYYILLYNNYSGAQKIQLPKQNFVRAEIRVWVFFLVTLFFSIFIRLRLLGSETLDPT